VIVEDFRLVGVAILEAQADVGCGVLSRKLNKILR
jgi:hypothetical protein